MDYIVTVLEDSYVQMLTQSKSQNLDSHVHFKMVLKAT